MAACQPTVRGFLIFHVTDETDYNRWQSGVYYADGTPKSSRPFVKQTMSEIRSGAVDCGEPPVGTADDGWSVATPADLAAAEEGSRAVGGWVETPYSYLATTKASEYTKARRARRVLPKGSPYLVVYPFVKIRPWYALSPEDRQRIMEEHMRVGAEFVTIHNHTTYSFGIDDQEFMTAFECDEPSDFMHLMLTLRESEASRYTERDTPIFVGQHVEIRAALDALDGKSARVQA